MGGPESQTAPKCALFSRKRKENRPGEGAAPRGPPGGKNPDKGGETRWRGAPRGPPRGGPEGPEAPKCYTPPHPHEPSEGGEDQRGAFHSEKHV